MSDTSDTQYNKSFPVSWDQFHRDARALAWRLADKGPFEAIVCITRGGLVPAAIVARELGLRLIETICVASYEETVQGELKILRKVKNPVWVKPDWAFVEEGYEPPKGMRDRVDDFSLGDYGLYMRDGYIIHGTIFKTLLGKRVTHGCIRLGDEDLKYVYDTVPVGARVFLY